MKTTAIIAHAIVGKKILPARAGRATLLATVMVPTLQSDARRG